MTNDTHALGGQRAQMLQSHATSPRVAGAGTGLGKVCDWKQEGWMAFSLLLPMLHSVSDGNVLLLMQR